MEVKVDEAFQQAAMRAVALSDAELNQQHLALWIGHEQLGLSSLACQLAQLVVSVPCIGHVARLSLSVEVAVCLSEVTRQRDQQAQRACTNESRKDSKVEPEQVGQREGGGEGERDTYGLSEESQRELVTQLDLHKRAFRRGLDENMRRKKSAQQARTWERLQQEGRAAGYARSDDRDNI